MGVGWANTCVEHLKCGVPTRNETQNIYSFTTHLLSSSYVPGTGRGAEDRMVRKTKLSALSEIPTTKKGREETTCRSGGSACEENQQQGLGWVTIEGLEGWSV
jgi:hypothetical protein